ncbi:MAG: CHAT domain-containing tetratricopeptide repeat protein [Bacteroidota bacterium]
MRAYFCALLLVGFVVHFSPWARAQDATGGDAPTQRVLFAFEVLGLADEAPGDSLLVLFGSGPLDRLVPGGRGTPFSVYQVAEHDSGGDALGTARVVGGGRRKAAAHVWLSKPKAPQLRLYPGDLLELPITIPADTHDGLLLYLAQLGIRLTDNGNEMFVSPEEVFALRSTEDEQALLKPFADAVHEAGDYVVGLRESGNLTPLLASLFDPIGRGYYEGRLPFDLMLEAITDDLIRFLDFVRSYPGKYVGGRWKISETFATWLINSAPLGRDGLRDFLLSADNLDAAIARYDYEHDEDFLTAWRDEAKELGRLGQLDDAFRLLDLVERTARHQGWEASAASALFSRGLILTEAGRYRDSVPAYEQAIAEYERLGGVVSLLNALYNISINQVALGDYTDALATSERGTARAEAARAEGNASPYDVGEQVLRQGVALKHLGRYDDALAVYSHALTLYEEDGSTASLRRIATVRNRQAEIQKERGLYRDARAAYEAVRGAFAALADTEGEADALDELGFVTSNLGQYEEAIALWREADRLHRISGHLSDAGYSLSQIAQSEWRLGRTADAIATHRAAIGVREQAGDLSGQAYSWRKLASLYTETGRPTLALEAFDRADALYAEAGSTSGRAEVLIERGNVFTEQNDHARALPLYEEALALFEEADDREEVGGTLSVIGNALVRLRRYREAEERYARALEVSRALGKRTWQVNDLVALGNLAAEGQYDRDAADAYYREALELAESVGATTEAALAMAAYGRFLSQAGRFDEAEARLTEAYDRWVAAGNRVGEAWTLIDLGHLNELRGDFERAREQYEASLAIGEAINDLGRVGTALAYLGDLAGVLAQFDEAEAFHRQALAVSEESANLWGQAGALNGLGNLAEDRADYAAALDAYARADSLYDALGSDIARAGPINNAGVVHLFQGDYAAALGAFERTRAIYEAAGQEDAGLLVAELNVARALLEQQRWDEASAANARAFALAERFGLDRITAAVLYNDGRIALERPEPDPAAAAASMRRAVVILETTDEQSRLTEALGVLGRALLANGEAGAAETMLERAATLASDLGMPQHVWEPTYTLALIREQQGRDAEAVALLRQAVEAMETVRARVVGGQEAQRRFAEGGPKVRVYEALVAALIEQGQTEEALAYLDRSYSDDLRAQFGDPLLLAAADGTSADGTVTEADRLRALQATVDQLETERAQALAAGQTARAEALAARLSVSQSEYRALLDDEIRNDPALARRLPDAARTLQQERRDFPDDLAVVTYLVGESRLFLFVATQDSVGAEVLNASVDEVQGLVQDLRRFIATPTAAAAVRSGSLGGDDSSGSTDVERYDAVRQRLYDLLIAPAVPRIGERARLAIIPNGPLYDLPFAVLPAPDDTGQAAPEQFLIEDRTLFYVSDLSVLYRRGMRGSDIRIRAFGNATTDSLEALPFAEREVEALAQLYPGSELFVREAATERQVKAAPSDYTVLHLATHGVLDPRVERSYLALAPDGDEDGRLTLDEVRRLDALGDYRLVTLSACESALGNTDEAAWPINPALAFLENGARTVVASLWKVDDAATGALMEAFYTTLAEGDAAAALQHAQTTLLADPATRHPYYWAPFVLLGDDQ